MTGFTPTTGPKNARSGGIPRGGELANDAFYLKALTALIESRYPEGRYGHSTAQEIMREIRAHARDAKRVGACLMCGHCTHCGSKP